MAVKIVLIQPRIHSPPHSSTNHRLTSPTQSLKKHPPPPPPKNAPHTPTPAPSPPPPPPLPLPLRPHPHPRPLLLPLPPRKHPMLLGGRRLRLQHDRRHGLVRLLAGPEPDREYFCFLPMLYFKFSNLRETLLFCGWIGKKALGLITRCEQVTCDPLGQWVLSAQCGGPTCHCAGTATPFC